MRLTTLFKEFYDSEKAGGITLIIFTCISLFLANSAFQTEYLHFWHTPIGNFTVEHVINDGLMTIFFLLVGLELEREVYIGELSSIKQSLLPSLGALGGMLIPAGLYLLINMGTSTAAGAGIPMATDIAFALGILSLLGNKVNASLRVYLTALAVIDDLGAIVVIAIFYTNTIVWTNLAFAFGIMGILFILNRLKVYNLIPYFIGGGFMWYFMLHSGVHATITGVLLAFVIPFGGGDPKSSSYKLQHFLHKPVAFIILPIFALANTAIVIGSDWHTTFELPYSLGIMVGLVIGKPLGIFLFTFGAVALGICTLPKELNWKQVFGAGLLGGIGFTMSIFVCLLSFQDEQIINNAKFMVLISSLMAGILGFVWLKIILNKHHEKGHH